MANNDVIGLTFIGLMFATPALDHGQISKTNNVRNCSYSERLQGLKRHSVPFWILFKLLHYSAFGVSVGTISYTRRMPLNKLLTGFEVNYLLSPQESPGRD